MPNEPDPIANSRRKRNRQAKLPADASCVFCGETTPEMLLPVKRALLNSHHVLTEAIAPKATVVVCLNHHALETARLRDVGIDGLRPERTLPETLVSVLRSLGGFCLSLGEALLAWAEKLTAFVGALDSDCPGWRQLPEART